MKLKDEESSAKIDEIILRIRTDLIHKLMNGAMGLFPRDSIDSAAALLYDLLIRTEPNRMKLKTY